MWVNASHIMDLSYALFHGFGGRFWFEMTYAALYETQQHSANAMAAITDYRYCSQ